MQCTVGALNIPLFRGPIYPIPLIASRCCTHQWMVYFLPTLTLIESAMPIADSAWGDGVLLSTGGQNGNLLNLQSIIWTDSALKSSGDFDQKMNGQNYAGF